MADKPNLFGSDRRDRWAMAILLTLLGLAALGVFAGVVLTLWYYVQNPGDAVRPLAVIGGFAVLVIGMHWLIGKVPYE